MLKESKIQVYALYKKHTFNRKTPTHQKQRDRKRCTKTKATEDKNGCVIPNEVDSRTGNMTRNSEEQFEALNKNNEHINSSRKPKS